MIAYYKFVFMQKKFAITLQGEIKIIYFIHTRRRRRIVEVGVEGEGEGGGYEENSEKELKNEVRKKNRKS